MKKDISSPHDKFFRSAMEDPRVAREFLEEHLPTHIKNKIDLSILETCPGTFVDEELKLSESDVLIKTSIQRKEGFVYILVEHQSTIDHSMPLRLFKYMLKIWEHFQIQEGKHKSLVYPVIVPLVFYTGRTKYSGKQSMWDLCGENAELMHGIISNPFNLIDVNTIPDEELKKRLYSGTMEFVMQYRFRQHFEKQLLMIVDNLTQLNVDPQDHFLLKLIKYILTVDEKHNTPQSLWMTIHEHAPEALRNNIMGLAEKIFHEGEEKGKEKGIEIGTEKGIEIGTEKGIEIGTEKGIEIGVINTAIRMLKEGIDPAFVAKITQLPISKIKSLQGLEV